MRHSAAYGRGLSTGDARGGRRDGRARVMRVADGKDAMSKPRDAMSKPRKVAM